MNTQSRKHTYRNLIIFTFLIIMLGWFARWLDLAMSGESSRGIGLLIWLIAPLGVSFLLRAFAGDGWKDLGIRPRFKGNGLWYATSIFVYPIGITLVLMIGFIFGTVSFPGFSSGGVGLFIQAFVLAIVTNFIKNIFEEFAWRGYLTPKINALGLNIFIAHIIVGVIWAAWHLPYYFGLLVTSDLMSYTTQSMTTFIPLVFTGLIAASMVYGEIRLLTNSIWPVVLLHTIGNALILTLLLQDYIEITDRAQFLFTPGQEGILITILFILIGILIYRRRRKMAASL